MKPDCRFRLLPIPLLLLSSPAIGAPQTALTKLDLPVCGDTGIAIRLPLKRRPDGRGRQDCPMACHLASPRRRSLDNCG